MTNLGLSAVAGPQQSVFFFVRNSRCVPMSMLSKGSDLLFMGWDLGALTGCSVDCSATSYILINNLTLCNVHVQGRRGGGGWVMASP